jgi:hypothetical protein
MMPLKQKKEADLYYTEDTHDIKHFDEYSATSEQIEEYTEKVRKNQVKCHLPPCGRCNTETEEFKRHEARQRQFYVIAGDMVKVILGLLIRWKCPGCNKTSTGYPDFAVPYKRYTVPTIKKYSSLYTEDHQATYREVILKNIIGYPDSEHQLHHTSIHRWITSLGNYSKVIRTAQDLYLQAKPESGICRELASLSIPSKKLRTQERKSILQRCRQLLKIEIKFRSTFNASIFPHLATKCGFS